MIFLKVKGTKSWLDPQSQHALAANLSRRLWARCQGHRGLFVTLTYRRDEYQDAEDLYRRQSEEQHVPLFLRKVERYLRRTGTMPPGGLKGRWFCKMEFQRGGWVHWHIIILDIEKIPHAEVTALWGRGHVWLKRLNRGRVHYCCKYVCKGGAVPTWLYGEPSRSIKIIRVSPGFWGEVSPASPPDPAYERPKPIDAWVPIGLKIERARERLVVRDDRGRTVTVHADLGPLLVAFMERGCGVVGNDRGWVVVDADLHQLERAIAAARPRAGGGLPAPAAAPPRPLHLKEAPNPDAYWLCRWLDRLWWEGAMMAEGGLA